MNEAVSSALMLASSIVDPVVALAAADPQGNNSAYPEELQAVQGAVPKRRREFAAGRMAARKAMAELGAPAMAIPVGQDRAPIWPAPLVGSITHCDCACLAAIAWAGDVHMLGLDIEEFTPLAKDLLETVCTPSEQNWLSRQENPLLDAKLVFSVKECVYKAQYPLSNQLFDFQTLEMSFTNSRDRFSAQFTQSVAPFAQGDQISGKIAQGHGLIVSAVTVRA